MALGIVIWSPINSLRFRGRGDWFVFCHILPICQDGADDECGEHNTHPTNNQVSQDAATLEEHATTCEKEGQGPKHNESPINKVGKETIYRTTYPHITRAYGKLYRIAKISRPQEG